MCHLFIIFNGEFTTKVDEIFQNAGEKGKLTPKIREDTGNPFVINLKKISPQVYLKIPQL